MNTTFKKLAGILPSTVLVIICITSIIILQIPETKVQNSKLTVSEYQKLNNQEQLNLTFFQKLPSLGFQNILADWLYLKFIQYFGDSQAREKIGYTLSPDYFTQIVDRDPRFVDAMIKLDTATSIFAGNPRKSVDLLAKSLDQIPSKLISVGTPSYYLWLYKGIDELLFLGNPKMAKKSYKMARNWAKTYPDQNSKNIVSRTEESINFLEKNPKSKVAQIGAWAVVLSNNPDPKTIKRAIQEITSLGGKVTINPEGRLTVKVPPNIQ
jgi:hypothetical protein